MKEIKKIWNLTHHFGSFITVKNAQNVNESVSKTMINITKLTNFFSKKYELKI